MKACVPRRLPAYRSVSGSGVHLLVEFALVFPLVCMLLFGMIDGSRMVIARCMLSYAVIVGARAGVARANTVAVVQTATAAAAPMLGLSSGSVVVQLNGLTPTTTTWAARSGGDNVTVSYNGYTFRPAAGAFTKMITKTFNASCIRTIP